MNLCVVSTYNGTKEDYLKLYESFKDDIAKYTDGFEMGFVRDGKVIIVANVTDEEKFYALFEDPRSKEFGKFNNVDDVYRGLIVFVGVRSTPWLHPLAPPR